MANPQQLQTAVPDPGLSEYPLLHAGTADVFAGVPGGVSPRGDQLLIPIVGNNGVAGGMMGQGKSNACRVIMLGCALDPLAELDVFVFAMNGDFDSYEPRLRIYCKGVDDDVIEAAVARLHQLYAEVGRREGRLAELGAKKLTRQLAEQHRDMRPIVSLFSECHELFGHKEMGDEASDLATKTAKRARKTGITLLFDTQSSRKEAIPPKLVELVSVNICFAVKSWRSNDGFLGDGSFQAGIRATNLRPGRDRGTSLVTGVSDAQFELLRWHFIEVDDDTGFDAAADVIARGWGTWHRAHGPALDRRPRRSSGATSLTTWTRCSTTTGSARRRARAAPRPGTAVGAVPEPDRHAAPRPARRRRGADHERRERAAARPRRPSPGAGREGVS